MLEGIEDPEEARCIVAHLASGKTRGQEPDRLAKLTDTMPTVPSLSQDKARKVVEGIVCDSGDYEPREIDDDVVDQWREAYSANE